MDFSIVEIEICLHQKIKVLKHHLLSNMQENFMCTNACFLQLNIKSPEILLIRLGDITHKESTNFHLYDLVRENSAIS